MSQSTDFGHTQMILTFHKTGVKRRHEKRNGFDLSETVRQVLSASNSNAVYGEYLFNRVVIDAWNKGAIDSLTVTIDEFTQMIENLGWHYDPQRHYWFNSQVQASLFDGF